MWQDRPVTRLKYCRITTPCPALHRDVQLRDCTRLLNMPILETGRLLLRPWSGNDFNSYAQMMAHPEVVRFLGHDPLDRAEAWRSLALLIGHDVLRGFTLNAVVDKVNRPGESGDSTLMKITLLRFGSDHNSRPSPVLPAACHRSIRRAVGC